MYDNDTDDRTPIVREADDAYEAIRAINHATINAVSIPAPVVYDVLGNLKLAAGLAAQIGELLEQAQSRINSQGYRTPEES